jgi:hypothetical protein
LWLGAVAVAMVQETETVAVAVALVALGRQQGLLFQQGRRLLLL